MNQTKLFKYQNEYITIQNQIVMLETQRNILYNQIQTLMPLGMDTQRVSLYRQLRQKYESLNNQISKKSMRLTKLQQLMMIEQAKMLNPRR